MPATGSSPGGAGELTVPAAAAAVANAYARATGLNSGSAILTRCAAAGSTPSSRPKPTNTSRTGDFDIAAYQQRNVVERCSNKLKLFRALATRYDKRNYICLGTIDVATIKIWLRDHRSMIHRNTR
jgi:transposase